MKLENQDSLKQDLCKKRRSSQFLRKIFWRRKLEAQHKNRSYLSKQVKHAQGFHNVGGGKNNSVYLSPHLFDAHLTALGWSQIMAEVFGTYFLIFAGCASVAVNIITGGTVTFPGICIVWGLAVMVMVYSVGHISGAHFNPAVTIAFATCGRFPWKQVPAYVIAQLIGSTLASVTLRLLFRGCHNHFFGTVPSGSDFQSFVLEFIISFYLMFVISGVATDNRAIGELAGLAVGATVLLNVLIAGPISGASMNPARTLGTAIILNRYKGIWVYIVGPISGTIAGAWAYNLIRFTNKPLREITKSGSFIKSLRSNQSN